MSYKHPDRPVIIKLTEPSVAREFERQRSTLAEQHGEELTNQMFLAFLLDTRNAALRVAQETKNAVDEHAKNILNVDDTTPRGTVD